jgi:F-type H+-transporting ATPase subunit b
VEEHHLDWLFGVVIPYVNFIIFLLMLYFFSRKALKSMAQGRRAKFEESANLAAQKLKEAKEALSAVEIKHAALKDELDRFISQSDRMTKTEIESIERDTKKILEQIKLESHKLGEEEFVRAKQTLRLEMVEKARLLAQARIEKFSKDELKRVFVQKVKLLDTQTTF